MPLVKLSFVDASGAGMASVAVNVNGAAEQLNTNAAGLVQFLLDDQQQYTIRADNTEVWQGALADLQRQMSFKHSGSGFALA